MWIRTVREGESNTFPACDPCWLVNRDGLVMVSGPFTVTTHCDECLGFMNPREFAVRRALVREVYRGVRAAREKKMGASWSGFGTHPAAVRDRRSLRPSCILAPTDGVSREEGNLNSLDHDKNGLGGGTTGSGDQPKHANGTPGGTDGWLRSVVEHSSEIVTVVEPDGTLRYANSAWARALDYDPDEAVGTMNVLDQVHPEDRRRVLEETEEALAGAGVVTNGAEYRFRRKDGSWLWVESVGIYLLEDPAVGGMVLVSQDVTERKEAEEALRQSEKRCRRQSSDLALLHRVRAVLARGLDLSSLLRGVVEAIADTYRHTQVSAYLLEGEDLLLQHQVGYERVIERIPVTEGVSGRAMRTGRPILVDEVRADRDFLGAIENVTSEICVPLSDGGEAIGLLNVESRDGVKLTREDLELMVTLGHHVSVAMGRATLHAQVRRSEERLRSLADATFEGILITDRGEVLEANRALSDMFGYGLAEIVGRSAVEFVAPEYQDLVRQKIASGIEDPYEIVGVRKDGTLLDLEVRGRAYSYRGRNVRVTAVRDITERKRSEERLRETEERYRTLVERIPAVTFIDRAEGSTAPVYVSPQIEDMLGYTPEEWMAGRLWRERLHPEDRERILASDERFEVDGGPVDEEYRLLAKDGSVVWVREETVLVRGEGGEPLFVQGILSDITERKRAEERLHYQAFHDPLTGLPNRRLFMDHLGHALKRTRRQGNRVGVLFMDLDQFKVVNDSLGHDVGDLLLKVVAQRLLRCLRPEDTLARFGGDEFVVLLEALEDPAEAVRVAERITKELRSPFILNERQLYATASIGVSLGHARTHGPESLLREADTAMYRAKAEGAGYEVFDPAMYERALGRLELENDLRRATEQNEFVVHYQPIVDLQTGAVWGVEALVRWRHPGRGLLDPDEFVPAAEKSGLVVPMGELVLEDACHRAAEWQREFPRHPPLAMSVNLSGRQLRRPDLHEVIARALAESGLPASSLGLDITETVYIGALEANTAALDRLKALGVRISLDDFGSGYSSLSYLKRLPADILKIDKSFTRGLGLEVEDTAIVQTVIDLGHILGMAVVAEGVEIEEQETLLREMGCDFAQGFHIAEPLPPEAASEFLGSRSRGVARRNDPDGPSDP